MERKSFLGCSALMANRCIREMLTGLAMYKKGMRGPHYDQVDVSGLLVTIRGRRHE